METLVPMSDGDEPKQVTRTEAEKIAQYRIDYRANLGSVGQVLSNKINMVPALMNQVISKA